MDGEIQIMKTCFVGAAIVLAIIVALPTSAGASQPFDARAFQKAQAAGKTTLIHVGAPWCGTCRRQQPIIHQIEQELPNVVVYEVDFDTEKDVLERLGVRYQTTLIVFKGTTEMARSVGQIDPGGIRALVAAGL